MNALYAQVLCGSGCRLHDTGKSKTQYNPLVVFARPAP